MGPLLIEDEDSVIPVTGAKVRVVLAALLLEPGRVVPADRLAEAVWGERQPRNTQSALHNLVMRLRRSLGARAAGYVRASQPGYVIDVDPSEVDIHAFTGLCRAGRDAHRAGDWTGCTQLLRTALALWRGDPLADIPAPMLAERERPRLEELRLDALGWRIDADLQLGLRDELIAELRDLTDDHPMRENFHGQLMLALHGTGRQAEALAVYQRARAVLVTELGTEPGPALRELHEQILRGAPAALMSSADGEGIAARPGTAVPRQVPAAVGHFTGRVSELAALSDLLDRDGGTVVVSAIGGTAGVGKTALALRWAHQVADRFPDGQLYVNLRGHDVDQPMPAADALAHFLEALGVAGSDIPPGTDGRAAVYRSLLATRRMLVLLDNAGEVEQVRPLLPGAAGCAVLVTSRDSLAALVARDGAQRLDLDLLPRSDALGLLRTLIGGRADADPGATAVLADQCCRLPLALRVAAELAIARPHVPLAGLTSELADVQRRLDLLDAGGDPRTAVRSVFSWSYLNLDPGPARAFRLAGLHPGPDFDPYALAALTGSTRPDAARLLDQLTRAHLIQHSTPGRYCMHDLLRAYACELAAEDGTDERHAALTRLFDHQLHTAACAMDAIFPAESGRRPRIPRPPSPTPPVTGPGVARAWLDAERASLVAAATYSAGNGWPAHATQLAATLFRYLNGGGHLAQAVTIHRYALIAGRSTGDRTAQANALSALGSVDLRQDRYRQAASYFRQALALHRETSDRTGQARMLNNLALTEAYQGRYSEATAYLQDALGLFGELNDQAGQAHALDHLGTIDSKVGRYRQATGHLRRALEMFLRAGDRSGEAHVLLGLGYVDLQQGRHREAAGHLHRALALYRETGDRNGEAFALGSLGLNDLRRGSYEQAADQLRKSVALSRETGDRNTEATSLNGLGDLSLATSRPVQAQTHYTSALILAAQIGDPTEQARAHDGLARACHAMGNSRQAHQHSHAAFTLYTELGVPEADQVGLLLAATDSGYL